MQFTGRIIGLTRDYITGKFNIVVEVNEDSVILEGYDKFKNIQKLLLKMDIFREKRSLNANSYFHVLVDKISKKEGMSAAYCKNQMIYDYGQPDLLDDGTQITIVSDMPMEKMLAQEQIHCWPYDFEIVDGKELVYYRVYRGTHTYDTKEMSVIIDGTVQEAKALGIDTLSTEEIRKMKERWGV